MPTVEMGRDFRTPKTNVICRQVIAEAHHDRLPVSCMKGRAREDAVVAPNLTQGQVGVEAVICLPLMDVIELLWEKLVPALMRSAGSLPGNRVDVRRRIECRYRLGHRNDGKFNYEWSGRRALDLLVVI